MYSGGSDQGNRNKGSQNWLNSGCILKLKLVRFPNELDVGYDGMEESRMTVNFLDWSVSRMDWPSNWIGNTLEKEITGWKTFIILI